MSMHEAIENAADVAAKIVAGVKPDQLDDPTPCSEFDVRALGNHMTGFLPYAANAFRKGPAMEGEAPDFTQGDWARAYRTMAADLVAALGEEGALEGEVEFGAGSMPAQNAAGITLMELTVHAWDLARATGQEYRLDPATAQMAAAITSEAGPGGRQGGFFGPEMPAPEGASEFEKALAISGRDPNWSA
jgi:uncharacterized protein (TIGR03086 family)